MPRNGISILDLGPTALKQVREQLVAQVKVPKPAKYRNVKTRFRSTQGFELTAASKAEARGYAELDRLLLTKRIVRWIPQVGFLLQGGSRYVCDALIFWSDGQVTVRDYKGVETPVFKIKRGLMRATYNIEIECERGDAA